jgi:magnesium transporter
LRRIEQVREWTPAGCDGAGGLSPEWISYAIIDDVTDSFLPLLKYLEYEADCIGILLCVIIKDDLVLLLKDTDQTEMLRRIATARKKVLVLLRLSQNKPSLLRMLLKLYTENQSSPSNIHLYLSDILDHLLTICQALYHAEKSLARSHANYLAQISIEITLASNRFVLVFLFPQF